MKNLAETTMVENKNNIQYIMKGIMIGYGISLLLLFLFSILLTYTNMSENMIAPVILVITIISILIGSSISSNKMKKNGLMNGGIIGLLYISILYIISSFTQIGFHLNIYAILMIVFSILAGMVRRSCGSKLKKVIDKV